MQFTDGDDLDEVPEAVASAAARASMKSGVNEPGLIAVGVG